MGLTPLTALAIGLGPQSSLAALAVQEDDKARSHRFSYLTYPYSESQAQAWLPSESQAHLPASQAAQHLQAAAMLQEAARRPRLSLQMRLILLAASLLPQ